MRAYAIVCLSLLPVMALAQQWGQFEQEFDEAQKPWVELQAKLPMPPQAQALIAIEMGPTTSNHYFVDPASLSSEADGVVRYTMVIEAAGGARNVSFEGMRCASGEWKLYAFGRPDGEWVRNKYARWSGIKDRQANSYHRELFYHYFCTVDGVGELKVIRRALSDGGIRRGEDTMY